MRLPKLWGATLVEHSTLTQAANLVLLVLLTTLHGQLTYARYVNGLFDETVSSKL